MSTENTGNVEKANPSKKLKVVDNKILKKTYYIPKQKMQKFLEQIEERSSNRSCCSYNLQQLQEARLGGNYKFERLMNSNKRRLLFVLSCYKALYAQDWNKFLYLMKKVPNWEMLTDRNSYHYCLYPRLQMILLMFHPKSRETGALNDYLHMAWGCRMQSEKKAILKVLLTLQKRICKMGKFIE